MLRFYFHLIAAEPFVLGLIVLIQARNYCLETPSFRNMSDVALDQICEYDIVRIRV